MESFSSIPPLERQNSESSVFGYKRETKYRIFVNRSLQMEKIKFFGFDMDYTLAAYKSPQYEELAFQLIQERLMTIGYPEDIRKFNYDSSFAVRGLWFDKEQGTLLKTDQYGNILFCIRGFKYLSPIEVRHLYPNKFLVLDESRIYVLNTLFNLPETYMLACVVHWFTTSPDFTIVEKGVKNGSIFMSYRSIFQDIRTATDWIHSEGNLKQRTVEDIGKYVHWDERMPEFLTRLRSTGSIVFLLTNSEFSYTDKIMKYILGNPHKQDVDCPDWTTYFDYIVVDAKKPLFFKEGTVLRSVDRKTGRLNIGLHVGPLERGHIYNGGSCEVFSHLIGARGKDVLYVGDHIFGDILKSKKIVGWRTFLVIPELANEIYVWKKEKSLFDGLQILDNKLAEAYRDMNISSEERPDVGTLQSNIRSVARKMEEAYGVLGSLFRNGSRYTFFSSQVMRYADIYSFSCLNLMHYPLCYMFRAPKMLMAHESTVSQSDSPPDGFESILDSAQPGLNRRSRGEDPNRDPDLSDWLDGSKCSMQVEMLKWSPRPDSSPARDSQRSSSEKDDDEVDDKGECGSCVVPPMWSPILCPKDEHLSTTD